MIRINLVQVLGGGALFFIGIVLCLAGLIFWGVALVVLGFLAVASA